jgi:hypothetical protein
VGVFAQELYKVFPLAVSKGDEVAEPEKIENRWMVDYSKLVPVLVAAVQDLSKENEALKNKLATTEAKLNELNALKAEIEKIKETLQIEVKR